MARASDARVIITGRNPDRLASAGEELQVSTATLHLTDTEGIHAFFAGLTCAVDHVLVSGGAPTYAPIASLDLGVALQVLDEHLLGSLRVARECAQGLRPGGSLTFITGSHARHPGPNLTIAAILAAALPTITANAALELAPTRVNAVAAGFVDTPLSARLLGDELRPRLLRLQETLPIRRVVGSTDVAKAVIHLMTNTAVTGATFDVDGGQQLISS
ncbi:MAG TPA: SDR family oxidoreductase [Pseudonocardiaceae bacterium]|nr:SDR family oxidoreductase [Pseudonocardiaceae bacterium]